MHLPIKDAESKKKFSENAHITMDETKTVAVEQSAYDLVLHQNKYSEPFYKQKNIQMIAANAANGSLTQRN